MRQLETISRRARLMLVTMRGSRWLAAVLASCLAAGAADYVLRLPGWLRLVVVLAGVFAAAGHLAVRLRRVNAVRPRLTSLALRLERMYPRASGRLASAVAFATEADAQTRGALESALAEQTLTGGQGLLDRREIDKLINPSQLLRSLLMLLGVMGVFSGVAVASPGSVSTAWSRWTNPLGDARWPNRYAVESRTAVKVASNNAPLRVEAEVTKGDAAGLRTWVVYRFERGGEEGAAKSPWQRALMTRQATSGRGGMYQRPIEPATGAGRMVFYFEAGDDRSDEQGVELIQPPTLRSVSLEIEPPAYAAWVVPVERHDLLQPPRPLVSLDALEGSRLRLRVYVEGSFTALVEPGDSQKLAQYVGQMLPGLLGEPAAGAAASAQLAFAAIDKDNPGAFELSWVLRRAAQFHFRLLDAYGTAYEDQRQFRLETRPDRPPRATILQPAGDESVLPTAMVELSAEAQDDVAVARLRLEVRQKQQPARPLADNESPTPRSSITAALDLGQLKLKAGEELGVVAVVTDNFLLDGRRHDAVESTARYLRVISPEDLVRQMRTDLAELRQRAIRAQATQGRLIESIPNGATAGGQQELREQLENMGRSLAALRQRMQRNKLEDKAVARTLEESGKTLADTAAAAQQAGERLERAAAAPEGKTPESRQHIAQARQAQQQTKAGLDKLVQLLDQGRDAYELQQNLVKVAKEQDAVADETRQAMPRTLGRPAEQLPAEDRRALEKMAERQKELGGEVRQLAERMQSTAAAISRQSERPEDQAMAEALREAASTAMQEGLDEKMSQASRQVGQNQLAEAQQQQQQAQDVLKRMLQQMGKTDKLKQEILQRKLAELVESIRRLRDQQAAQLARLGAALKLVDLDAPLIALRRNTLAVAEGARTADPGTLRVADVLEKAAGHQGDAAAELRSAAATKGAVEAAEGASLARLNEALKLAEELAKKAMNQKSDEERRELVKAYAQSLEEQKNIREATAKLSAAAGKSRDRRWRADALAMGNRETAVGQRLQKLKEKLEQTVVYMQVHDELDGWINDAAGSLKKGQADNRLLFTQDMIVASLESLIEALKPNEEDENFAMAGGNSGGGGQPGGQGQLIPPLAELKLLRGRQDQVHKMTRLIDRGDKTAAEHKQQIVTDLSRQQQDLAETALKLVESMKQQRGGGVPAPLPIPPREQKP